MSLEVRDQRFSTIVGSSVECEKLASGFLFTEGPVWNTREDCLLFTDIPNNQILRWSAKEGITVFRKPSNMANGLAFDHQGRLLACEHAVSQLTRTEKNGQVTVIASHYQGKELNSPNDVVVKSDGAIYFSDPSYGRNDYYGVQRNCDLAFKGVYRAEANGENLTLLADDFDQPNGLCFSSDESKLFINDSERAHIRVFDVKADGTLTNNRVWTELTGSHPGVPDGMKIDSQDNVYCTGPGGIHVFDRSAKCLGVILVPEVAANLAWGDKDLCSLFITASNSLYRVRVKTPGRPVGK